VGGLSASVVTTLDTSGVGVLARGRLALDALAVFGALRLDANSASGEAGAALRLEGLLGAVTVGLDQRGFKWVQLEASGEFDLFGSGAAS
jgi:hypothetical protein